MLAFSFICLLAAAAALPAPQSSETTNNDESVITDNIDSGKGSEEKKEDEADIKPIAIPEPPVLKPIPAPIVLEIEGGQFVVKPGSSENKDEKEKEDLKPDDQKPIVVTLEVNRPSFLANLFSNFPLSWPPSFPSISLPSLNFPSFPFFGGASQHGRIVYPEYDPEGPDYRYVYVK